MSTEAVVGASIVDGEQHDERKRLCLFGSGESVDIDHALLGYRLVSCNEYIVKGIHMQLAHLDCCVATV